MKAFENWNKKNKSYLPLLDNTVTSERSKGWRAALEEVLRVIIEESNGPSTQKDLMIWLNEELGEWEVDEDLKNNMKNGKKNRKPY